MNGASPFAVTTQAGERLEVKCPICAHDKFLASGPSDEEARKKGFQHVVIGLLGGTRALVNPVRFMHCGNCGFIVQMMLPAGADIIGRAGDG